MIGDIPPARSVDPLDIRAHDGNDIQDLAPRPRSDYGLTTAIADQKMVTIVTFEHFRSRIARLSDAVPTDGGRNTPDIASHYFRLPDLRKLS